MPVAYKQAWGLTWDEVRSGIGLGYFPYSQLQGGIGAIGPHGGFIVVAGIDQSDFPNAFDHVVQVSNFFSSASAQGTAIITGSADAEGKVTYLDAGVEKNTLDKGVIISCDLGSLATYFITLQTGNNVPAPDPDFSGGTPPPPNKVSTPVIVSSPQPDDEWGNVTLNWTTPDDLDTEVMGFQITIHPNYPGAVAYVVGVVPALTATHPNYTFTYAIGANEWPDPTVEYTFTVEPYLFGELVNTLGEESDESEPVIYDPEVEPPPEEIPDVELPPLDPETGEKIPGEPVEIPPDDPNIFPPGTLKGAGYGGFNLGGSSLEDAALFIMNPSGIYTLVEGKTHDTLYERMTGITSQNVKIPDPFVKTGFI